MQINLKEHIAKSQRKFIKNVLQNNYKRYINYGGRMTTKSSADALAIIVLMMIFENLEVIVVRENYTDHNNSTVKELIIAIERLGLQDYYIYHKSDKRIEFKHTGSCIYFGAMNDYDKLKGFKPTNKNKYFGIAWFFEITEFRDDYHMTQAVSTFVRGKKEFWAEFYEFNPAEEITNWTYSWLETQQNYEDTLINFTTWEDLTEYELDNWIGQDAIKEIKNLKKFQIDLYENIYLGLPRLIQGKVYKSLKDSHVKIRDWTFTHCSGGIDYGDDDDTGATILVYDGARRVHVESTLHITDYRLDIIQKSDMIHIFFENWCKENKKQILVNIDSANLSLKKLLLKKSNIWVQYASVKKTPLRAKYKNREQGSIQERIDYTNILFAANRLTIDPNCIQLIKEFRSAKYHEATGFRLDTKVYLVNMLDSFEYAFRNYILQLVDFALIKGELDE